VKPFKICQVIDQAFLGGGQKNLLALVEGLDRSRFQVSVCSREDGPLREVLREKGISHLGMPFRKGFSRAVLNRVEAVFREHRFDLVHTHGGVAGMYGRWAARRAGIGAILHTFHGIHYLHSRNPFYKAALIAMERRFSRFTDGEICVSEFVDDLCRRYRLVPENKRHVIKNGIDFNVKILSLTEDSQKAAAEIGLGSHVPWIGTVARLDPVKGLDILLKAVPLVLRRLPRARFVVVGGGAERTRLQSLAERLGVSGAVYFVGERSDALAWMKRFDIFTLPSRHEALPYTILEAAALQKAVAASAVGGILELIAHEKTGLLVEPRHPETLAEALLRLGEDAALRQRFGGALRESLVQEFSLSRMLRQTQDLYLRLLHEKQ
jgi:glycosyltransferase involved in cell wall biosynthesis